MKKKVLVILGVFIIIGGLITFNLYKNKQNQGIAVTTVQVAQEPLQVKVFTTGRVNAKQEEQIYGPLTGAVKEVLVETGDEVKSGQILVRFDTEDLVRKVREAEARLQVEAANLIKAKAGARQEDVAKAKARLDQAESALANARLILERVQALAEAGAVTQESLEEARLEVTTQQTAVFTAQQDLELLQSGERPEVIQALEAQKLQAEVALQELQKQLALGEVRSPLDGVVLEKNIDPGQYVTQGMRLFTVGSLDELFLKADISEGDSGKLAVGQPVEITGSSFPDQTYQGELSKISPVAQWQNANQAQTVVPVEIKVTGNPPIKPGVSAEINIVTVDHPQALVIPYEAVVEEEDKKWTFVVKDGTVEKREIVTGIGNELHLEVLEGLSEDEEVVLNPPQKLKDKDPVRVLKKDLNKEVR